MQFGLFFAVYYKITHNTILGMPFQKCPTDFNWSYFHPGSHVDKYAVLYKQ